MKKTARHLLCTCREKRRVGIADSHDLIRHGNLCEAEEDGKRERNGHSCSLGEYLESRDIYNRLIEFCKNDRSYFSWKCLS